jgi:hypothetical protein
VLEQQTEVGERIVCLIRQGTPFQAILASSLQQAHMILRHLKCDVFLLIDDTFPEEDLERLYLLPAGIHPPALLNLTWFSRTRTFFQGADTHRIIDAVNQLLSAHGR